MSSRTRLVSLGVSWMVLLLGFSLPASAAPYIGRETFTYRQPDGATFPVKLYGDEFFAYQETLDGYVILKDPASGYYCYAALGEGSGSFVSTGIPVVSQSQSKAEMSLRAAQAGVAPKLRLPADALQATVRKAQRKFRADDRGRPLLGEPEPTSSGKSYPLPGPPLSTTTGSFVGLCILVDFSDEPGTIPQANVDLYFNQASGYTAYSNACSVREYFDIQSGGLLDYTNVITSYVRVPNPKSYYDDDSPNDWGSSKAQELVQDALDVLMGQGFDFTQFSTYPWGSNQSIKCINVFYAGNCASGWSRGLWPHSWSIPSKVVDAGNSIQANRYQMTDMETSLKIGTMCHENGHMLCAFPDLYSYNGNPASMGYFSLMASGNHVDGGRHPVNVDPYLKTAAGWATIVDVLPTDVLTATVNVSNNTYYRFENPSNPQEYFIFETRGSSGYEGPYGGSSASVNPASGVLGYHALESGSNTHSTITDSASCDYTKPYELLLLEASPYDNSPNPWYLEPRPNSADAFHSGGVDAVNAGTMPELTFWASDGRTVASPFSIHSVSATGSTMTFEIGFASDEIMVFIQPSAAVSAGARWRLDGGAWRNSGEAATGLSPGAYTVSFSEVVGYNTPADEIVTLTGATGEAVTGVYVVQPVALPIALNAQEMSWATSGDADWYGQRLMSHDGHASGQSGDVADSQSSTLQTTVTGPGFLRFWWKVSSESGFDSLRFVVDGTPAIEINGEVDWTLANRFIGAGPHTVAWVYEKDSSVSDGDDCGWVDAVCLVTSGSLTGSLLVSLSPEGAVGAGAQWRLDGGAWQTSEATVNHLSFGTHTVSFNTPPGWIPPANVPVTIADNTVTVETGAYTATSATGALTVTIDPPEAVSAGALWKVGAGAWQSSGDTVTGLLVGDYTVTFQPVVDWQTPSAATVTVSDGATATLSGTYTSNSALPGPGAVIVIAGLAAAGYAALRRGRRNRA
ncbi:MAG: M6 family metalloprotease domain-containing protein [bacterium]|nr:M6 family metalloprotease domain-containing protein [bacterium]